MTFAIHIRNARRFTSGARHVCELRWYMGLTAVHTRPSEGPRRGPAWATMLTRQPDGLVTGRPTRGAATVGRARSPAALGGVTNDNYTATPVYRSTAGKGLTYNEKINTNKR